MITLLAAGLTIFCGEIRATGCLDHDQRSNGPAPPGPRKNTIHYALMNKNERLDFLLRRARLVSLKISGEPYQFSDLAIKNIQQYVEAYLQRIGNGQKAIWSEDLNYVLTRSLKFAPCIIYAFRARHVSPLVGLYIVAIETEFTNFRSENAAGASGLFQFIPSTALAYGVSPAERTNVNRMADAAARYMADRINEFGSDAMSVALAIASYNRSPDSVRADLQEVLHLRAADKERSFWTLLLNSNRLDKYFRNENIKYVPKFFAIAIIGETPWAFGLDMKQALSTYESASPKCSGR